MYLYNIRKENTKIHLASILLLTVIMYILYFLKIDLKYYFPLFVVLIYTLLLPSKLMSPLNIVFAYYFLFYVLPPLFANRYKELNESIEIINKAYLLCFTTYATIMATLDVSLLCFKTSCHSKEKCLPIKLDKLDKILLFMCFFMALGIYIKRTGGLGLWLSNPNDAFFSRRGSGLYYMIYSNALMILLFFGGKGKTKVWYIGLLLLSYIFIGSRSTTLIMVMMIFSYELMNMRLFEKNTFFFLLGVVGIVTIGLYIREKEVMQNFSQIVSTSLNYFDTFENLIISLRDFEPSFGKTFFLPINWILMRIGAYVCVPYHDMSIWLTTIYYPESWINGGTTQWPIETDLYLSFYYYIGLSLVIVYFVIIAYLYSRAQKGGIWHLIYINEAMYILSHLRGGIFIYWYFWLIPIYMWLIIRYGKGSSSNKSMYIPEGIERQA